jgi:hypothetical protein
MVKERRNELKHSAHGAGPHGKRFVGEDVGERQARAAERTKVHQMQAAARDAALRAARKQETRRAHEALVHRPLWEGVAGLVLQSARLATKVVALPFRLASSLVPRWSRA